MYQVKAECTQSEAEGGGRNTQKHPFWYKLIPLHCLLQVGAVTAWVPAYVLRHLGCHIAQLHL